MTDDGRALNASLRDALAALLPDGAHLAHGGARLNPSAIGSPLASGAALGGDSALLDHNAPNPHGYADLPYVRMPNGDRYVWLGLWPID